MFQKLSKSPELLKKLLVQNTLDEYYDFCTKIQAGYTKEELRIFFDDLSLLAKKLENSKIELDEELEQVCGGVDIKNFNRKFLSTFLSALTLSGTFSVGALQNQEKTNRENVLARNSTYSRRVTKNQKEKENQKLKLSKTEKMILSSAALATAAIAVGSAMISGSSTGSNSENSNSNSNSNSFEVKKSESKEDLLPADQFNAGLTNLGATCFSNALLQQLYSIKSFRKFVDSINSLEDLQQYDALKSSEERNKILKKINEFKKIFKLMGTVKCVDKNHMKEYVSTVLTGYPGGQQDISECYTIYLGDVVDLYQQFLIKGEKKDENKAEPGGGHCICGYTLEVPHEPKDWDDHFESTFPRRFISAKLYDNVHSNTDSFIDRYQQAYMEKYGYTDAALEISSDSEKDFLECLSGDKSKFMQELINQITQADENNLYKKYVFSTIYLMLKTTELSPKSDVSGRTDRKHKIEIYAAKAFSERQKLSEDNLKRELNSIFEVLNKFKNLEFGGIKISDLEQIKKDEVDTTLHNLIYNEVVGLFKECYEKKIKPSDGEDVLSPLTKNNPDGEIQPVDGQIAFFLTRTGYNAAGEKSTVRIKLDSESKNGFEWDYRGKKYVLSAVSVHSGSNISSGHYYTYKREADGNWYEYNDSSVYKKTWKDIKDDIEKNGVMFTFTEESVFEQSPAENLIPTNSDSAKHTTNSATQFENKRVCMAGIIDDYKVQSWERRVPSRPLSLEVIKTGKDGSYTGITDPALLNKLSSKSDPIAIIDAANNGAQGGSGVDGAIFDAMGKNGFTIDEVKAQIRNDFPAKQGSRIQTGGCIIHDSFGIKATSPCATHVIQAVGPRINDENSDTKDKDWEKELYSAYYNSFVLGISNGIKKFITAPISLGLFCRIENEAMATQVGEKAANILLHAINDAEKFNKIGGNIEVYVTDHHANEKSRNTAEDAFIKALYGYFPLSKGGSTAD